MTQDTVVIHNSKKKLFGSMLICLAFIAASTWLLSVDFEDEMVHWIAYGFIVFFGGILLLIGRRFLDDEPGLVLDKEGIHQKSPVSKMTIYWKDITGFESIKEQGQNFVLVQIENPNDYLNEASGVKAKLMKLNDQMYGTPLSISANGLKCNHKKLLIYLKEGIEKHANVTVKFEA